MQQQPGGERYGEHEAHMNLQAQYNGGSGGGGGGLRAQGRGNGPGQHMHMLNMFMGGPGSGSGSGTGPVTAGTGHNILLSPHDIHQHQHHQLIQLIQPGGNTAAPLLQLSAPQPGPPNPGPPSFFKLSSSTK